MKRFGKNTPKLFSNEVCKAVASISDLDRDGHTQQRKRNCSDASLCISFKYCISSSTPPRGAFTADLLAGWPAGRTTTDIHASLIIYLAGRGALFRQLIKRGKRFISGLTGEAVHEMGSDCQIPGVTHEDRSLRHGNPNNRGYG